MKVEQGQIARCWPRRLERRGHKPRKSGSPQKLGEARNGFSPRAFEGGAAGLDFRQVILTSDFWPQEKGENTFPGFEATRFAVNIYHNPKEHGWSTSGT